MRVWQAFQNLFSSFVSSKLQTFRKSRQFTLGYFTQSYFMTIFNNASRLFRRFGKQFLKVKVTVISLQNQSSLRFLMAKAISIKLSKLQ